MRHRLGNKLDWYCRAIAVIDTLSTALVRRTRSRDVFRRALAAFITGGLVGVRADLFVANNDDALLYEQLLDSGQVIAPGRYVVAHHQGLTGLEFSSLWAILEGSDWDVHRHMLQGVSTEAEQERWLEEFPASYVQQLAACDPAKLIQAAVAWSQTEELQCAASQLQPVLLDLQRLAQLALAEQKGLYLWGSL
jgi:hypothetical protein